jgi:hypothetical protein
MERPWLIWNLTAHVYWRPDRGGYTGSVHAAGRYSTEEALNIVALRKFEPRTPGGARHGREEIPEDIMVPSPELVELIQQRPAVEAPPPLLQVEHVRRYHISDSGLPGPEISVEWRGRKLNDQGREVGEPRWAVTNGRGDCLTLTGEWEWEPSPSNRDDEFQERTRWPSFAAAKAAALAACGSWARREHGMPDVS